MKTIAKIVCLYLLVTLTACSNYDQPLIPDLTNEQIGTGDFFTLRLSKDGSLYIFGDSKDKADGDYEREIFPDKKFKSIDVKHSYAAFIDEEGILYVMGRSNFMMEDVKVIESTALLSTITHPMAEKVKDVSIGEHHVTVITEAGKLYSWGNNEYSQLGLSADIIDEVIYEPMPIILTENISFTKVSSGCLSTLAIAENGSVYEWGDFNTPIVGNEMTESTQIGIPSLVPLSEKIIDADSGFFFDLLLTEDGSVLGRGRNEYGQSLPNGEIYIDNFTKINLPEKIKSVVAGHDYALALSDTGNVYVWGSNKYGQLGLPISNEAVQPTKLSIKDKIVALSTGENNSIFLAADNKKYVSGDNTSKPFGNLNVQGMNIQGLFVTESIKSEQSQSFIQISSGYSMSVAIDEKKRAYVWGTSKKGSLGNKSMRSISQPTKVENFELNSIQIDTVFGVTTVLLEDGDIYTWGNNRNYRLGLGHSLDMWEPTKVELPSPADKFYQGPSATIAHLKNGEWYAWGNNTKGSLLTGDQLEYSTPIKINIPFSENFISSQTTHSLLLDTSGNVYQWGSPTNDEQAEMVFRRVDLPEKIDKIATTSNSCFALSIDGNLFAWGENKSGQIGLFERRVYSTPSIVPLKEKIVDIKASPIIGVVVALSGSGDVYTWGYDVLRMGQDEILTKPTLVSLPDKIAQIVVGDVSVYAISESGDVYTWGGVINNTQGQPQRKPILMKIKYAF